LINMPDEPRLARSGALDGRPMHLPMRRHLHPATRNHAPEPILLETRERHAGLEEKTLLSSQEDAIHSERLRVYAYNQPHIFQQSGAASDTLVFDALFEGGNLQYADRVLCPDKSTHEYELYVHPDLQNSAYRQWFYFDVRNAQRGVTYHFSLVNLAKSGALFGAGLQPCVYSAFDAETSQRGWVHGGSQIFYEASPSMPGTNTLHFQYEFRHDHDCVSFACLQPYSYTDLVEYLDVLERDPVRSAFVRRTELCQTIAQNACDLLSITSASSSDSLPLDDKKLIVLSARVHPGEPNASWMMKGMLDYLTGASSGATVLRNHFIFKVVPMLNPDGVINGNTRVNLAGWDLNRKWSNPIEKLFPTIFHLKKLLTQWQLKDRVAIYCDLHGHSINRNIFTYGCCTGKRARKKHLHAAASHALLRQP
jgi:cytosolic carboxypeptidase protein 2/3